MRYRTLSCRLAALTGGVLLVVAGSLTIDRLMTALGATPTILPFARDYARYILWAAPVMCSSFVLNNLLRAEGKANLAMIGLTSGGILNCFLDPLFIFTFKLGIAGAAMYKRVRHAFYFTLSATTALMVVLGGLCFAGAPLLIAVFIKTDPLVMQVGSHALRAYAMALPLIPLGVMCNMTFQTIGRTWTATLLSMARQGFFFIPLVLILTRHHGISGVQIAQPLADVCTFLFCLPIIISFLRQLSRQS